MNIIFLKQVLYFQYIIFSCIFPVTPIYYLLIKLMPFVSSRISSKYKKIYYKIVIISLEKGKKLPIIIWEKHSITSRA